MKHSKNVAGDERSLDEIYQYEAEKRSTPEGIALAALGGDRTSLKAFAGLAGVAIGSDNEELRSQVLPWLLFVLGRITTGEAPNEAFGWARNRRGQPGPSQDMDGLRKRYFIGCHVKSLVTDGESQRAAASKAAAAWHVSASEAMRCFKLMSGK